jgi:hypothetical protein
VPRKSVRYALVALLGGSAVALAAATFPSTSGSGGPPIPGDGDGIGTFHLFTPDDTPANALEIPSFLGDLVGFLMFIALLITLAYAVYNWREVLPRIVTGVAIAAVLFGLLLLLMYAPLDFTGTGEFGLGDDSTRGGGGELGTDASISTNPSSLAVVLVLVGCLFVVGLAVVVRGGDADAVDEPEADDGPGTTTTAAVGRAAGRAADRIEEATELDNEIFRAWSEMARLVEIRNPETRTPSEFETAAVDAGMDPDDVRELTRLFEQVRYGTDEPTATDEQEAVDLFRRIEATYREDET